MEGKKSNVPHGLLANTWQMVGALSLCHDTSLTCADRKVLDTSICIFSPDPQINHVRFVEVEVVVAVVVVVAKHYMYSGFIIRWIHMYESIDIM